MTRPQHVAYVLKRFPRISETFIAAELIELCRQGQQVSVFAVARPDEPFTHGFLDELDVPVVYLPRRPSRAPVRSLRALGRVLREDASGFVRAARVALGQGATVSPVKRVRRLLQACVLRRELERAGVDHVHAHFATTASRLANLCWRMGGPTYSVTAHAKDIYDRDNRGARLRDKLDHATFVATVCQANRRYLEQEVGVTSPVRVVANSIDLTRVPTPESHAPAPGHVLTVARLVEKKGLDDLVRACGMLGRGGHRVRLEVIGDGPLRGELEELAAAEGVTADFAGALPHEEVVQRYRKATVFALPCVVTDRGDRDGLPTAVLEAMAVGVPVVATDVTGLEELIEDGESGLLVEQRDPEGLADALARVLKDPELGRQLGQGGYDRVRRDHDLRGSVRRLRSLFAERVA